MQLNNVIFTVSGERLLNMQLRMIAFEFSLLIELFITQLMFAAIARLIIHQASLRRSLKILREIVPLL